VIRKRNVITLVVVCTAIGIAVLYVRGMIGFVPPPQPIPVYPHVKDITIESLYDVNYEQCRKDSWTTTYRTTHFRTSDSPDAVTRFYHTALAEQLGYKSTGIVYGHETFERVLATQSDLVPTWRKQWSGVGFELVTELQGQHTVVTLSEYTFERTNDVCELG
jgi:hypothetical protein